jgi:hypothetical protein
MGSKTRSQRDAKSDFHLGQWVEFDHVLERESLYGKKLGTWRKAWIRKKKEPTQGIVVGVRHLTNGENLALGTVVIYTHKEFITAYLIAVDLTHKHKLVLIKDAKELK